MTPADRHIHCGTCPCAFALLRYGPLPQDDLKAMGVMVFDREKMWKMAYSAGGGGGGGPAMLPGGHDYRRDPSDGGEAVDMTRVDGILAQRMQAKMSRNFDEADRLRVRGSPPPATPLRAALMAALPRRRRTSFATWASWSTTRKRRGACPVDRPLVGAAPLWAATPVGLSESIQWGAALPPPATTATEVPTAVPTAAARGDVRLLPGRHKRPARRTAGATKAAAVAATEAASATRTLTIAPYSKGASSTAEVTMTTIAPGAVAVTATATATVTAATVAAAVMKKTVAEAVSVTASATIDDSALCSRVAQALEGRPCRLQASGRFSGGSRVRRSESRPPARVRSALRRASGPVRAAAKAVASCARFDGAGSHAARTSDTTWERRQLGTPPWRARCRASGMPTIPVATPGVDPP